MHFSRTFNASLEHSRSFHGRCLTSSLLLICYTSQRSTISIHHITNRYFTKKKPPCAISSATEIYSAKSFSYHFAHIDPLIITTPLPKNTLRQTTPTMEDWYPAQGDEIFVHFEMDNRTIWWPTKVRKIYATAGCDFKKLVSADVIYYKFEEYPETNFKINFKHGMLVEHLDKHGHRISDSSWKKTTIDATGNDENLPSG